MVRRASKNTVGGRSSYRLGSGGVLYVLVTGVILAAAIYTQANLLFWGFGLMVGGALVSVLHAAAALSGLRVRRVVARHGAAGEVLPLRYEIENRAWWPVFALTVREAWGRGSVGWRKAGPAAGPHAPLGGPPEAWVMHLGRGQTTQAVAPCRPRRRGRIGFERVVVSTSFPFSFIEKRRSFDIADEALVFPVLYRVRRSLLSTLAAADGEGGRAAARAGGSEEFYGLRAYRPGDPPRTIDWKRTARVGEPVSRELTTPRPPRLRLVLDLRETPPIAAGGRRGAHGTLGPSIDSGRQLEERAISLAASLVCEAHLRGHRVALRVLGADAPAFRPAHLPSHRTRMLETLAELDLTRRDPSAGAGAAGDVVVWPGRGAALPTRPNVGHRGATVLGAADFERYVTRPTGWAEVAAPGSAPGSVAPGGNGSGGDG
ncbi:MAG: DUF58 domain-containing protein [Planctomycetota bacterium]